MAEWYEEYLVFERVRGGVASRITLRVLYSEDLVGGTLEPDSPVTTVRSYLLDSLIDRLHASGFSWRITAAMVKPVNRPTVWADVVARMGTSPEGVGIEIACLAGPEYVCLESFLADQDGQMYDDSVELEFIPCE